MALLTSQVVTREALAVLHDKLDFIKTVNRQFDSSFGQVGAKDGSQLKIRLPNEYVTRTGAAYVDQGHDESSETLVVATQRGVDSSISDADLALSMDDFKTRVLEPQMSVLASVIEDDCLGNMTLDISDSVGTPGTTPGSTANQALKPWLQAKQRLGENLAAGPFFAQIDGDATTETVNGLASLYNDQRTLSKQYTEGFLLRNSGLEYYTNNKVKRLTNGTLVTASGATVNGDNQGENGTVVIAGAGVLTLKKGQIITLGTYAVHPETKAAYNYLKQFVITEDVTAVGGAATLKISPTVVTSGAKQNVSAAVVNGATVTVAGSASTIYPCNLVYAKNAFAVAFADLEMPGGMHKAYRAKIDGISLRFTQWWDGDTGKFKSRFDVLYGKKTIRAREATRVWG